jgi:hypothetical protein
MKSCSSEDLHFIVGPCLKPVFVFGEAWNQIEIETDYPDHIMSDIVQVINRELPTAAARVRAQFRLCWICGEQCGGGVGFLRDLRFLLPILIQPNASHTSSCIIRGW